MGLPGKNVRALGGYPLIAWAVAAGRTSKEVSRVLCSTDSASIAEVARSAGAEVPFIRPAALATSEATDLAVFRHAIDWLLTKEGLLPEFFVQLRPTTPFRHPSWIDECVQRMRSDPDVTCIRSIVPAPHTPYKMWLRHESGALHPLMQLEGVAEPFNMPRQSLPQVYWHTGQIDVIRSSTLLEGSMTGGNIVSLQVSRDSAVDIDSLADFKFAELVFSEQMPEVLKEYLRLSYIW